MATFSSPPEQGPCRITLMVAGMTISFPTSIPGVALLGVDAVTGVAGVAQPIQTSVAAEQDFHNPAGSQPLIGVEAITAGLAVLVVLAGRIRRSSAERPLRLTGAPTASVVAGTCSARRRYRYHPAVRR